MQFIVPGSPRGKQRARTARGHHYTPKETVDYQDSVRRAYIAAGGEHHGKQPMRLYVTAYYPIPQSWSEKRKREAILGYTLPMVKPDFDNVEKIISDALNGVAWNDDSQIVSSRFDKVYGLEPCVEVTIIQYGWKE